MNTNNFFSAKRFGLVFRNDFLENKKLYLLGLLFVFGIVLIIAIGVGGVLYAETCSQFYKGVLIGNSDPMEVNMITLFCLGSIVFTCVVASFSFSKMKSKQGRIADLTLPASHFEKFLVRWLNTVVLSMLAFVVVFFIADFLRVFIFGILYPELPISLTPMFDFALSDDEVRFFKMWLFNLMLLQSVYFLGSVCMPKYSLIKTFVVVMLVTICYAVFMMWISLFNDAKHEFNEHVEYWYSGMIIINYIVAYYRYRESEVIHRLF